MDKQYLNYLGFINSVRRKEKSMIFSQEYVVLSRNAYDTIIDAHHSELKYVSYDEVEMHAWIKKQFTDSKDER